MMRNDLMRRFDWRVISIISLLMFIGLLVISATSQEISDSGESPILTHLTRSQLQWFVLGWLVYFFLAFFDYRKLREWTWFLYLASLIALVGLFFTPVVQGCHRWYRIPVIGLGIQPSEYAKLMLVIALSWFIERQAAHMRSLKATFQALLIVFIPFVLILKQPDLGSALVLFPASLVMFYIGGLPRRLVTSMSILGIIGITVSSLFFLKILPHEQMRPLFTTVIKEYQYERLNPDNYHQNAAQTAIALGGLTGSGWRKSTYSGRHWLPESSTDSVFPAFAEEFGLLGVFALLTLFFGLIYFSFQVTLVAKDRFGRLLAAGITAYLGVHVLVNIGMMSGFLPITGVPLILITYGGSSVLSTMMALGILQSIYSRRFSF